MRCCRKGESGGGEEINQEAVNELVDYSIAHGVNYFDTAPMYIQGWAETATGIALKRHPRDKFFIATKMSDFIPCTGCQYCMPCPYGLDIPGIFTYYNRCITEGNMPKDAQDENYRRARRAFLMGFDRNIPKERQFDHCTGCSICTQKCPQSIPIPANMERIDRLTERLRQETVD
jgi:predicted aldo/keto reductase-like oxidoreductase